MAENPLLPNDELRRVLDLTRRCLALDVATNRRSARSTANLRDTGGRAPSRPLLPSREALLAATLLQLQPGDLLVPEFGDSTALALAPSGVNGTTPGVLPIPALGSSDARLMLAAAMAAALRGSSTDRLVSIYLRADSVEPGWTAALAWAQERLLPLLFVCADPRGPAAFRSGRRTAEDAFSWDAVQRAAGRLKLPILTVDGEDAVAVYRAMQESVLRARSGAGSAILWAMLPVPAARRVGRPRSTTPVKRLEGYLRTRGIRF